jgi:hypothetical protein
MSGFRYPVGTRYECLGTELLCVDPGGVKKENL